MDGELHNIPLKLDFIKGKNETKQQIRFESPIKS